MTQDAASYPRVGAVFATMNRAQTARSCVMALARQTRPPEWVVVADNVSTDGTAEILESLPELPFELTVLRMQENLGNAGGVRDAMECAFAKGADAVWILDDDSWPRPEALEALTSHGWNPTVVRHALQIDPRTQRFTWPLFVETNEGSWELIHKTDELPPGPLVNTRISWTGALLPKTVRDVVGPVNAALFIRGEDEEYPWRIEKAGFTQQAASGAFMDHPGPEDVIHWKMLGKNLFFEKGLADWKLHYKVRNMVWLKHQQSGAAKAALMAVAYLIAATFIDGPSRLPLLVRAVREGWCGKLGKI